jgi:hypothetical protein
MGTEKVQKNHTLSFPKWKYAENSTVQERAEEDKRNVTTSISVAMDLFKSEVDGLTVEIFFFPFFFSLFISFLFVLIFKKRIGQ